jgi:predicted metal-dependent peptidase
MLRDELLKPWRAEHLTRLVVGLDQSVAVEQDAFTSSQKVPTLFIIRA